MDNINRLLSFSVYFVFLLEKIYFCGYNKNMSKTLIFGGAFDPPHCEHVQMCKTAMKELGADRLVIVPTYMPPHKEAGFLDFDVRCELINRAFCNTEYIIDKIEEERKSDNYSAIVLPLLKQKYGDITYLIGGDSLAHIETWYKPQNIIDCCPITVCSREGYDNARSQIDNLKNKYGGEFYLLSYQGRDVSSSLIRAKLLLGESCDEISDDVYEYIVKEHLFDEYKPYLDKLRTFMTDELFEHSKAVVKRAMDFNAKHHLRQDFKKVFLAALLHDNAKQRPSIDGLNVPSDSIGTPVLHQFLGAEKAKRDFGVTDIDILDAIRYHTSAKANMSILEKLIYTADSLSDDRTYDPIPKLRAVAVEDFEAGFRAVLEYTYKKVCEKKKGMYPLTEEAKRYYLDNA